jgi:hypothetical protein
VEPITLRIPLPKSGFSAPNLPELNHSQLHAVRSVLQQPLSLIQVSRFERHIASTPGRGLGGGQNPPYMRVTLIPGENRRPRTMAHFRHHIGLVRVQCTQSTRWSQA